MNGSRRSFGDPPFARAMPIFLLRAATPWRSAGRRWSAPQRPESRRDAPTRAARRLRRATSAPTTTIAPTIRIRKAAGPSPTLKPAKSSPQPRHVREAHPAGEQCPRSAARAVPAKSPPPAKARRRLAGACSSAVDRRAPAAPDVDRDEQEQPHDVDEMPVPGRRLEAEMLLRREVALVGADQADGRGRSCRR